MSVCVFVYSVCVGGGELHTLAVGLDAVIDDTVIDFKKYLRSTLLHGGKTDKLFKRARQQSG